MADSKIKRIDVHQHMFPPKYVEECREIILGPSKGFEHVLNWTPEKAIEALDQGGVDFAVVSVSAPGVYFGDREQALRLARYCNEYGAELKRKYPGRFGFFASVPMPLVEDAVAEIKFAIDQLGADGVVFMTSYGDKWMGDPSFEALHEVMNERKTIAHVHPVVPPACRNLVTGVPENLMEFGFDTARTIVSLLYNGFMTRYPNIKWIFSHGGGAMPMMIDRIHYIAKIRPQLAETLPNGAMYELKRQYYDVGSVCNPIPIAALRELGVGQLLIGTDYPYGPLDKDIKNLIAMNLPQDVFTAIEAGNALRLFNKTRE